MKNQLLRQIRELVKKRYPQNADAIMKRAESRFPELISENPEETEELRKVTHKWIYPAIAVMDAIVQCGETRDEAHDIFADYFTHIGKKASNIIRMILKFPWRYRKMPELIGKRIEKKCSVKAGYALTVQDQSERKMAIDITTYPYHSVCNQYGYAEIVHIFCDADDTIYRNMHPNLIFGRTKNAGTGQ